MQTGIRRRSFLKAAGVALTLPALESLGAAKDLENAHQVKRLFLMADGYGFHTPSFYPEKSGENYPTNSIIEPLEPLRAEVSLLGGLGHLHGHGNAGFVAAGPPSSNRFGDSIDQRVARDLSRHTPLDSLRLTTRLKSTGISYRDGVQVSMLSKPDQIFDVLFTKGNVAARDLALKQKASVLDLVRSEAKSLEQEVSAGDRRRLDDYFNSIRETELMVEKETRFLHEPAVNPGVAKEEFPPVAVTFDNDDVYFPYLRGLLRFVELAFRFDLTRVACLWEPGRHHGTTHQGSSVAQRYLTAVNTRTVEAIASMLSEMKNTQMPGGGNLLDETLFVWTSSLGSADSHKGDNVPAILAGGRLKHHGRYTQFAQQQSLSKLYLTILEQMGIEAAAFGDTDQTLTMETAKLRSKRL